MLEWKFFIKSGVKLFKLFDNHKFLDPFVESKLLSEIKNLLCVILCELVVKLDVLKKFVSFKQTENEIRYKLEQLRALDNDVKVHVGLAKSSPIGVDTQEDFVAIKKIMEYKP